MWNVSREKKEKRSFKTLSEVVNLKGRSRSFILASTMVLDEISVFERSTIMESAARPGMSQERCKFSTSGKTVSGLLEVDLRFLLYLSALFV